MALGLNEGQGYLLNLGQAKCCSGQRQEIPRKEVNMCRGASLVRLDIELL